MAVAPAIRGSQRHRPPRHRPPPLIAERQRIRALDLLEDGIVHAVVPEEPAADEDPRTFVRAMVTACPSAICELAGATVRSAS
jgi:acetyl-CoA carboxylase alpha subunit